MKTAIVFLLVALVHSPAAPAGAVRYEQIPADAGGFFHVEIDALGASPLAKQAGAAGADAKAQIQAAFGGVKSCTGYLMGREGRLVLLLESDAKMRASGQARAATGKDAIVFLYDNQEVHCSSDNPWAGTAAAIIGKAEPVESARRETRSSVSLGFPMDPQDRRLWNSGPLYTAFIGDDLIVATTDLHAMAHAIDVLQGKKPSLAKQDPQGLKADAPAGTLVQGVGATAEFDGNNIEAGKKTPGEPATRAAPEAVGSRGFGLNLFGSFRGKARMARFDMGCDEQNLFLDATFAMTDAGAAEQLKNLASGVKALVSLSQSRRGRLIDPLEIQVSGKDVLLHWKWPIAKLAELSRLSSDDEGKSPTTSPDAAR